MNTKKRLDRLTSARFFAALAVVFSHFATPYHLTGHPRAVLDTGQYGVDFFFVLSGFVLAWSYKPSRSTQRFYWLRFARVWPTHVLVIVLLLALGIRSTWRDALLQIFLIQQWNPHALWTEGINGVSWTLAVEAFFYACFPFLMKVLPRLSSLHLTVTAATLWLLHGLAVFALPHISLPTVTVEWATFTNPAARLPQFVAGIAVALILKRNPKSVGGFQVAGGLLWVAVIATLTAITSGLGWPATSWLFTPAMAYLVYTIAAYDLTKTTPAARLPVKLGEWSFALYLTHRALVIDHLLPRLERFSPWIAVPAVVITAVAISAVTYEFFELPVERWLRRGGPKESSVSTASAPTT